ncbi:MAG: AAA family ATPase [Actinobacteria bacterium]|nr:AAA family ATPase [Actinomycetota bacterium]
MTHTTPRPGAVPRAATAQVEPLDPERFAELAAGVEAEIRRVIVGQRTLVRDVLACLFAEGHVLLEGVPGLGKTVLLRTLGQALSLDFSRVQCTPDLMPADIVGTTVLGGDDGTTRFQPGPVFTQLLLADEINRATPKTQSALLEAMAERGVTVGGVTRDLPRPFFVMATQNPIEMEGTYPLPEAQLDRFLAKVLVPLPSGDDLVEILARTTGTQVAEVQPVAGADDLLAATRLVREVPMAEHVTRHVVDLVSATHPDADTAPEVVRRYVTHGASPRGAQSLVLIAKVLALFDERLHAAVDDVRAAAGICLRHRLVLGYEALPAGVTADDAVAAVLDTVAAPTPPVRGAV